MKLCIVSSCGGHLTEVRQLLPAFKDKAFFYVVNDRIKLPNDMLGKTYFIRHSERDIFLFIVNLWEAFQILLKEDPDVILSTGAGPIVPFALIGRLFFNTKIIFVETITRVNKPSLTGRIMYYLASRFFYQWKPLGKYFPKGTYGGLVL